MSLNDIVQVVIVVLSLFGIGAWALRLRRWPLMIAALVALGFNVLFLIVRSAGIWTSSDLNHLSLVRIFLLTLVIVSVPFSTHEAPR